MSSPFAAFRKQQKTLLAILGVMCMIAFVFGSTQCAGPTTGPTANAVVASTKYGDLREGELYEMRMEAITVDRFLSALVARTMQALVQEQKSLEQFQQQIFMNLYNSLQNQGMILFADENQVDESVLVDTMLLARRAQQNGIVISDRAINEFLEQITQEKLTRDDLASISNEMKINQNGLFEGLRTRLAARSMRQMFVFGLTGAPPAQKWEYYLRLNRRARAEMVAVPVASFVDDVKTPDEATIRSFFEKHKEQVRRPGSPEPGFKQPHKVALQYFKADYEQFMDEDAITDEEIEAHYEKFKDTRYLFTDPVETPDEEPKDEQPNDAKSEAEKPAAAPEGKKPAVTDPEKQTDPAKAPTDEKQPDAEKKAEKAEKKAEQKADDDQPEASKSDDKPQSEKETPPSDKSESDPTECDDAGQEPEAKPAAQTSDKAAPADATTTKPDDKKPEGQKPDDKEPDAKKSDNEKSDTEKSDQPASTEGAATSDAADASTEPKEPSLIDLAGQLSLPRSIREGPRPQHNPLWRVEKDIRRELAGQKASEKMAEVYRQIKPVLDAYYDTYNAWKADHPDLKGDAEHPRPERPDFAALAEKHGLTAHETGLQSLYEIATETDVGQALADMAQRLQRPNYVEAVLQTPPLYKAFTVQDLPGNQYLYWKVNNVEEHVPTLADEGIRDEVVDAWKEIEARDLAQKKAEQLAEQARGGKALSELVADDEELKLIETQPFTWMTAGNPFLGPSQPRLTEVPGVESPGEDFMRAVFGLAEGQTAVAFNAPKSVAYAIRVTSLEPSVSVLRETFAVESPRQAQNFFALGQEDNFEATRQWIEDVREDAGLHWNRPAVGLAMRN